LVLMGAAFAGDAPAPAAQRTIDASVIVLRLPAELGVLERPAVEFHHGAHVAALEQEGCAACHARDGEGRLIPALERAPAEGDWEGLTDSYHDACMGCHKDRADQGITSGPVKCGECHVRQPASLSTRQPLAFDYSLHHRHVAAMEEKCDRCHHVYNEQTNALEYGKGVEDACRRCHGDENDGDAPSLRHASHASCVACHLQRREKQLKAGPILCEGCHDAASQQKIATLTSIPRLLRGQKDQVWIAAGDARGRAVPFDHKAHEGHAPFCTHCHRRGMGACKECHTLSGELTHETAFHLPTSDDTCVGCHARESEKDGCAGCHPMPGPMPGENTCERCHSGPLAEAVLAAAASPPPFPASPKPGPLPPASDASPETVVLDRLAEKYGPSKMPHRKIVAHLDALVRDSELAMHFHGRTETLCAGCHHHSPAGERPTACASCHGEEPGSPQDKPSLKVAYHRQCVGCHQRMGIEEQGCTDCHAETAEEVGK